VTLAAVLNSPPLLASYVAGKVGADDLNVIALWRLLIGMPAMLIWILLLGFVAGLTGYLGFYVCYLAVSLAGLWSYYRVKKLAVIIHNGLRVPRLGKKAQQVHRFVIESLSHENTFSKPYQSVLQAG